MRYTREVPWMIRRMARHVRYYRQLAADPRTPRVSRWLLLAAIGYLVSPIDLVPDFIPVLGQLDDLLIVPLLVWLALLAVPLAVKGDARAASVPDGTGGSP